MRKLIERMRRMACEYQKDIDNRTEKKTSKFLWFSTIYLPNLHSEKDWYYLGRDQGIVDCMIMLANRIERKLNEGN